MSMSLDDSAAGNAHNALFLARACDLAYYAEPEGPARFRSELGLEAKLISVDNTQVYVAENDQAIVVAFRGSEAPTTLDGLKDWLLTNANNYLILPEGRAGRISRPPAWARGFTGVFWMHWRWSGSRCSQPLIRRSKPRNGRSGSPATAWGERWHSWPRGGFSAASSLCTRSSPSGRR